MLAAAVILAIYHNFYVNVKQQYSPKKYNYSTYLTAFHSSHTKSRVAPSCPANICDVCWIFLCFFIRVVDSIFNSGLAI